jgi:hypothetical protein
MGRREGKIMDTVDKKLIDHIINWLDDNIDEYNKEKDYYDYKNQLAMDSQDLKEKIQLYLEGVNEFG